MMKGSQNKQNKTRKRRLVFMFITAVTLAGVMAVLWASLPPVEPSGGDIIGHLGVQTAHAQGATPCSACHPSGTITGTCDSCHNSTHAVPPADPLTGATGLPITFTPHHGDGSTIACALCHGSDVLNPVIPATPVTMAFCQTCHSIIH